MSQSSEPWKPAPYETDDVVAIQALATGTANDDQQLRALKWIVECAAAVYQPSFHPGVDGDRLTAYAEGKRFVGHSIIKLTKLPVGRLREQDEIQK